MDTTFLREKLGLVAAGLTAMGIMSQASSAASVQFSAPSPVVVDRNSTVRLDIEGMDFSTAVDAGSFTVTWDPTVLSFQSFAAAVPPWNLNTVSTPDDGLLPYVTVSTTGAAVGPAFDIGSLVFTAVGLPGDDTSVELQRFGGWTRNGTETPVTYNQATVQIANVSVPSPVPLVPAIWLFGSALAAFSIIGRKRMA